MPSATRASKRAALSAAAAASRAGLACAPCESFAAAARVIGVGAERDVSEPSSCVGGGAAESAAATSVRGVGSVKPSVCGDVGSRAVCGAFDGEAALGGAPPPSPTMSARGFALRPGVLTRRRLSVRRCARGERRERDGAGDFLRLAKRARASREERTWIVDGRIGLDGGTGTYGESMAVGSHARAAP